MNFEQKIIDFQNYLLIDKKYSNSTIESYTYCLCKYCDFMKKQNLDLKSIKKNDIKNYLNYLKSNKMSSKTINHNLSCLRSFYKYLIIEKYLVNNPLDYVESSKLKKVLPKVLSKEEINELLNIELVNKYSYRNKAMLELMYATGLRVSELVSLKIHDIDYNMDLLRTMGKGSKERIIPIGEYAMYYLKLYVDNFREQLIRDNYTDYIFLNNHGKKLSRQSFYKIVKELAVKKNIKTELSPHTLRHSFATHLIDGGADIKSIQEMLGHSSLQTTQIYTHISNKKLEKDYHSFHPHG